MTTPEFDPVTFYEKPNIEMVVDPIRGRMVPPEDVTPIVVQVGSLEGGEFPAPIPPEHDETL